MGNPTIGYTRKEVTEITSMPGRRIQFYTDNGVLVPEAENLQGRGTVRRYSCRNIFEVLVINEFARYGIPLGKVREIMELLMRKHVRLHDANAPAYRHGKYFLTLRSGDTWIIELVQPQRLVEVLGERTDGASSWVVIELGSLAARVPR